jgi:hypothetical protein
LNYITFEIVVSNILRPAFGSRSKSVLITSPFKGAGFAFLIASYYFILSISVSFMILQLWDIKMSIFELLVWNYSITLLSGRFGLPWD